MMDKKIITSYLERLIRLSREWHTGMHTIPSELIHEAREILENLEEKKD